MARVEQGAEQPDAQPAPDAVAPPPGHPRFPLFDSLRAIAACCVLLTHTAQYSGSITSWYGGRLLAHLDIGVTFFFLISGFLLYRPFVASRILSAPATRVPVYAWRRLLRIAPAYWVALIVLTVVVGLHGVFSHNWWAYFGLLWKLPIYTPTADCVLDAARCGIAPTWSLAIEVWFYATLPLFAWGAAQLTRRAGGFGWFRAELCLLALVAIVSIPIVGNLTTDLDKWLWYSPLGHGLWFALGMALAAISVRANQTGILPRPISWIASRPGVCWLTAAAIYLLASLVVLDPVGGWKPEYTAEYILFGVVAAFLLLPAVFDDGSRGVPRRILANPVLAWLGLISYGIFLYNWPVVVALDRGGVTDWWPGASFLVLTSLTVAVTVACATASYYLVERPILRLKYRRRGGDNHDDLAEKVAAQA